MPLVRFIPCRHLLAVRAAPSTILQSCTKKATHLLYTVGYLSTSMHCTLQAEAEVAAREAQLAVVRRALRAEREELQWQEQSLRTQACCTVLPCVSSLGLPT